MGRLNLAGASLDRIWGVPPITCYSSRASDRSVKFYGIVIASHHLRIVRNGALLHLEHDIDCGKVWV